MDFAYWEKYLGSILNKILLLKDDPKRKNDSNVGFSEAA